MKISELLGEISKQGETIASVAKRIDGISEKPLRKALQEAGYIFSNQVPKGWHYHGEGPEPLDKSIFDYARPSKSKIKSYAQSNGKNKINNASNENSNDDIMNDVGGENSMKAEIEALISGKRVDKPKKLYRGFYFDNDIVTFLDNIQHGNKSELVNKIVRAYLTENDLM